MLLFKLTITSVNDSNDGYTLSNSPGRITDGSSPLYVYAFISTIFLIT